MTLCVRNLYKSYGAHSVLQDTHFEVRPGEVHALLGPNGAGKSTLIKCIGGVEPFDSGEIALDDQPLHFQKPADAFDAGVVTIHQHLSLVDSLSIADNLNLGMEKTKFGLIRRKQQEAEAREILRSLSLDHLSPSTPVRRLTAGTRQLVEIAKSWHRTKVKVLILDEPTSALTEDETKVLFSRIQDMREAGVCIIYTTHRLGEIYRIADRVTVLRDGGVALTGQIDEVDPAAVVKAISGGVESTNVGAASTANAGPRLIEAVNLSGPRFGPIDLEVRAGEIVGLYGVLGAGKTSMLETLAGKYVADSGQQRIGDREMRGQGPAEMAARGVGFVPSDRHSQGMWLELTALENLMMPSYVKQAVGGPFGLRRRSAERRIFAEGAVQLDIQPADPQKLAKQFSGGNQQKIAIARWTTRDDLRVLLLDEPTQGVDVGARAKIYELCEQLAEKGYALLFASSDADEVARLAHRALVVEDGRIVAELSGAGLTEDRLLASAHELA